YTFQPINVVLAKALIVKYFKEDAKSLNFENYKEGDKLIPWDEILTFKGAKIEGAKYEQLFHFKSNSLEVIREITPGAEPYKVISGDFVTTEDGTGIVHTAPAFGADDYKVGQKNNLGIITL